MNTSSEKDAIPEEIRKAILEGRIVEGMDFSQRCWALTARIPRGRVTTYAILARAVGCSAARPIGSAMHRNPFAPQVPCHRVVASNGMLRGYAFGLSKKERMLREEGVRIKNGKVLDEPFDLGEPLPPLPPKPRRPGIKPPFVPSLFAAPSARAKQQAKAKKAKR